MALRREMDEDLLKRLQERYAEPGALNTLRMRYARKRIMWFLVLGMSRLLKRSLDIVGSSAGLLALSPLFMGIAILIWKEDGRPIFYRQIRVGRQGELFWMYKFRSMFKDADKRLAELQQQNETGGVIFKMQNDPRITKVGRYIRKASIDELPQLWNVLRGEMSLVGPRPPIPGEVSQYSLADRRRLSVKPGITCLWQIGGRSELSFDQQVQLDVRYIESQSFWTDMEILLKTIPAVISGKGAY